MPSPFSAAAAAVRRLARGLLFALLPLLAAPAAGLDPQTTLTQYGHTAWRVRDGFFAGPPTVIAQTQDGFLWIGTMAGLLRFDGVRFVPWEPPAGSHLPDGRIINLLAARDGSLWIGTANGLARWHASRLDVVVRGGRFGALLEDRQGTIWAGHTRALEEVPPLCRFAHEQLGCFRFPDERTLRFVSGLHEDRQGGIWIGGENGACRWRQDRPQAPECHEISELAAVRGKLGIFEMADDADGSLLAAVGQGIWRLAAGRWQPYSGLPDPRQEADSIYAGRGSELWFGIAGHGLARRVEGRTERFTHEDGLSGDEVGTVFEDREGSVWVTTSTGLDRFRDVKVVTLTAQDGLHGGYFGAVAAARDGGVWVAEKRGLLHLGVGESTSFQPALEFSGSSLTSLLEDSRGRLWLGIGNGLSWREKNGRFFPLRMPDGSPSGIVVAIVEDRAGDLWVATTDRRHSVLRIREGRVVAAFSLERLKEQVTGLAPDPEGGVWVSFNHQMLKLDPDLGWQSRGGLSLGATRIYSMLPEARGIWLATTRGLGLWRPPAARPGGATAAERRLDVLDRGGGLPCEDLQTLVAGADGSLWLKASCGLIEISKPELDAWVAHPGHRVRVRLLDAFDGAEAGLSPFAPRAARSRDGRLWFVLEEAGLQRVDPKRLRDNVLPPPMQILRVVADRHTYPPATGLRLPALTRDVEIDYAALSLAVPEKVRFRYRLEGAEKEWQDPGTRREAYYTNLGPGAYRFRVVACNNDGVWNREGATLAFTILPAFYQTRWFLALAALALAALAWGAFRWRVRQVRASLDRGFEERLAERTRIAQDLHDTLLQGVLSASMQLYAAVEELPSEEPARGRFERVQQLMRQVIDEGRGALRGLRSAERSEDDLGVALSRVPGELGIRDAADGKPGAALRVVVEGRARPLQPGVRDEIYRIAREALVNAFRHSGASAIEVEIEYAARQLRVVIRDDGAGIDPEVLRAGREGHWGLSGMRERAERIGAHLKVWSRDGAGTEIELAVPGKVAFTA